MKCYHPITAYKTANGVEFVEHKTKGNNVQIALACGQCIGCRDRRRKDWALRIMHEAQTHKENCFITLTYAPGNLPPGASLHKPDFQKFLKRLRHHKGATRYYMCGEYGDENQRPHYHACLFGQDFTDRTVKGKSGSGQLFYDSKELEQLWGYGSVSVQDLMPETAAYCAGYIMKKILGKGSEDAYNYIKDGQLIKRIPPYADMSKKPGLGTEWYNRYANTDLHGIDRAVMHGTEHATPKYYDKLTKRNGDDKTLKHIENIRMERAKLINREDSTPERLTAQEAVHRAKNQHQHRNIA